MYENKWEWEEGNIQSSNTFWKVSIAPLGERVQIGYYSKYEDLLIIRNLSHSYIVIVGLFYFLYLDEIFSFYGKVEKYVRFA